MILILHIINANKASWLVSQDEQIKFSHDFTMTPGEDSSLLHLDELLKNNKLKLNDFTAMVLAVKEASLTQVKVITATVNTLAWQLNLPLVGKFYFKDDFSKLLPKLLKQLLKVKRYEPLGVEYQRKPDITISKKKSKYTISK